MRTFAVGVLIACSVACAEPVHEITTVIVESGDCESPSETEVGETCDDPAECPAVCCECPDDAPSEGVFMAKQCAVGLACVLSGHVCIDALNERPAACGY